jgi:hypothetical protein
MKGKYATRAANRREATEVEQTEAAYRRQIVRLTQERDEARRERDESRRTHKHDVRKLEAAVREGTSARVVALTRELERLREREDKQSRLLAKRHKDWEQVLFRAEALLMAERGLTSIEAMEVLLSWGIGPAGRSDNVERELEIALAPATEEEAPLARGVAISAGYYSGRQAPMEATKVLAVQRARGIRS